MKPAGRAVGKAPAVARAATIVCATRFSSTRSGTWLAAGTPALRDVGSAIRPLASAADAHHAALGADARRAGAEDEREQ